LLFESQPEMVHNSVISPIVAALQAGSLSEAERLCRSTLTDAPDHPDILLLLGLALQRQSRPGDALVPFARLTELYPQESMHWRNYATALDRVGDTQAARNAVEKAVELAPDDPEKLEQLGLLCLELGTPQAARAALLRARERAPDAARICIHAARAYAACHDDIGAGELLLSWREWLPLSDELQLELADLLTQISETWDALELLEGIAQRKPTDWAVQLLLAKVYERINRPDQAEAKLDWIEAMQPSVTDSNWIRPELDIQRSQLAMRRREYSLARRLLEAAGPRSPSDAGYYFSLAKACDRLDDAAAAMGALDTAHRLQIEDLRVSNSHLLEPDTPLLPGVDDRVSASDFQGWPTLQAPDASQSPVFVVGFPRSGTTLLEQMLDAHPHLQSMDERPFLNILASQLHTIGIDVPEDLAKLTQRDCDELRKGYVLMGCRKISRRWDVRLVDKNPLNMLWLPMLHRLFPKAKIILAIRHPCDVIWSCYLQNFRATSLAVACRSLVNLAHAYVAAMRQWLHHVEIFHPDVLMSRYEDLVADTPKHMHKIAKFLDLADADAMLSFVARAREKGFIKTPSYTQVVEPINARSVNHWLRYRPFFDDVLPVVQPMLEHWGYNVGEGAAVGTVT
jgi:Flp pilus assembly protein TadD